MQPPAGVILTYCARYAIDKEKSLIAAGKLNSSHDLN
jgi:hypothetical protein